MTARQAMGLIVLGAAIAAAAALAPAPPNDFQFAIMGDRTGQPNAQVYVQLWREIGERQPAFVINAGDTIEGYNPAARAEDEWTEMRRLWQQAPYPLYCTPGNHDIWSDFARALFEKETGHPRAYSFDFQNAHFTVLDNSRTEDLSPDQLRFLEKDLQSHSASHPKFVFFHKPFWIVFLKVGSGEFPLHRIARKYGVDYVISGHLHQFIPLQRDGIVYAAIGSSGGTIERGLRAGQGYDQGFFYGYVWAAVKGAGSTLSIHEAGPPSGQGRSVRWQDWAGTTVP